MELKGKSYIHPQKDRKKKTIRRKERQTKKKERKKEVYQITNETKNSIHGDNTFTFLQNSRAEISKVSLQRIEMYYLLDR